MGGAFGHSCRPPRAGGGLVAVCSVTTLLHTAPASAACDAQSGGSPALHGSHRSHSSSFWDMDVSAAGRGVRLRGLLKRHWLVLATVSSVLLGMCPLMLALPRQRASPAVRASSLCSAGHSAPIRPWWNVQRRKLMQSRQLSFDHDAYLYRW